MNNAYCVSRKTKDQTSLLIPALKALRKVGQDINARRRRRITIQLMAERAGISRTTIGKIEKGDPQHRSAAMLQCCLYWE